MSGVYGNLLNHFPELKRQFVLWRGTDKSSSYTIVGIYFDDNMQGMHVKYVSKGNSAVEIQNLAQLYVSDTYTKRIEIGDYMYRPNSKILMRLTKQLSQDFAGGYTVYEVCRVTGSNQEHTEKLNVKGAYFA